MHEKINQQQGAFKTERSFGFANPVSGQRPRGQIQKISAGKFHNLPLWNADEATLHSALMLAARITLPHFSVSSVTSLPKSAGDAAWMRNPRSSYFALISGRARDALISLLSTSTISAGIFFGPAMPSHLS